MKNLSGKWEQRRFGRRLLLVGLTLSLIPLQASSPSKWGITGASAEGFKGSLDMGSLSCSGAPTDCGDVEYVAQAKSGDDIKCAAMPRDSFFMAGSGRLTKYPHTGRFSATRRAALGGASASGATDIALPDELTEKPLWVQHSVWDMGGTALLASDLASGSMFHFSFANNLVRQVITTPLNSGKAGKRLRPSSMQLSGTGYVIEGEEGHLIWVGKDFSINDEVRLSSVIGDDDSTTAGAWSWVDLGDEVVVFGDKGKGTDSDNWRAAVLRFKGRHPTVFRTVASYPLDSKSRQMARLSFPLLAAARGKAYFLLLDGEVGVYEVSNDLRRLRGFPAGYDEIPKIDPTFKPELMPSKYATLVRSRIVVGLYGIGDFLYLLTRRPDLTGGTIWSLFRLDPSCEQISEPKILPTSSEHIVLAPGPRDWAIIEKEEVAQYGKQRISRIVLFSLKSLGLDPEAQPTTCSDSESKVAQRLHLLPRRPGQR